MTARLAVALLISVAGAARVPAQATEARAESDRAIRRGLDYLKSNQRPNGSWTLGDGREATSITSLSVLAFLACGHTPEDPGPYREAIAKGVRYVVEHQQPNGLLATNTINGPMYCHGISTLMLAEVAGMIAEPSLGDGARDALRRGVELILAAQAREKGEEHAGGWRYQPDAADSDLSVTGWQVMALRAARDAGVAVPTAAIDRAVDYIKKCATAKGGFGYQPGGGPNNPRTGTGTLALELCGVHHAPEALAGAAYLTRKENAPKWSSAYFFYEAYYVPQALFQVGDPFFPAYYPGLVRILLEHQGRDGSWLSDDGNDRTGGRAYCTAMAVLALAVEYRYLPIYQR